MLWYRSQNLPFPGIFIIKGERKIHLDEHQTQYNYRIFVITFKKRNIWAPSYYSMMTECSLHMELNFVTRNVKASTNMLQTTKGVLKRLVTTFYFDYLAEISFVFWENLYVSLWHTAPNQDDCIFQRYVHSKTNMECCLPEAREITAV